MWRLLLLKHWRFFPYTRKYGSEDKNMGQILAYFVHWNLNNFENLSSSVIMQKSESQNRCYKKTKHAKFSEKRIFRTCACASQGGRKCLFFGKFDVLCFLVTPLLRFALLLYCRQVLVTSYLIYHLMFTTTKLNLR